MPIANLGIDAYTSRVLIEILELGERRAFECNPGQPHDGYWCRFRRGSTEGWAHVASRRDLRVPPARTTSLTILESRRSSARLEEGDPRLSVETSQRRVDAFRKLEPSAAPSPSVQAMVTPGDFRVVGVVVQVTRDDAGQALVLDVDADGCAFAVSATEVDANLVGSIARGDQIEFVAVGVSLWDEGY